MFILHMTNKKVQEKLCTEPKEPEQALEFAIAFEEGIKRQKSYGTQLKMLGYQFVRLDFAGVTVSKSRVLVAPNSGNFIVGRDWLIALRYQIKQPIECGECERTTQVVNSDQIQIT